MKDKPKAMEKAGSCAIMGEVEQGGLAVEKKGITLEVKKKGRALARWRTLWEVWGTEIRRAAVVFSLLLLAFIALVVLGIGCPIKGLLGMPCPGCGLTRGCLSALRLDFAGAFRWHPLFWLGPTLLFFGIWRQGQILKNKRWNLLFWCGMAVLFVGVYLWRMYWLFPDLPPLDINREAAGYQFLAGWLNW